jgi:hypothetical protein
MSLWGNLDASNNAPIFWDASGYTPNVSANASVTANAANGQFAGIYGNTTIGFWREGVATGVFGVDTTEASSLLTTGDGRTVTHAGWVERIAFTGPVLSIAVNAAAVTVNSYITFNGGSSGAATDMTGNVAANARIFVNTTGHIVNVQISSGGSYANTPRVESQFYAAPFTAAGNTALITPSYSNAAFTLTMGGRANRVVQETLVAMGSMTGDATVAEDSNYPDS